MSYDPVNMKTQEIFDALRLECDEPLWPLIDAAEERWLLASSAAKLWFSKTADEVKAERARLDQLARVQEGYVD